MTHEEKLQKETELVSQFMKTFNNEFGYYPMVVTKNNRIYNEDDLKTLDLETLKSLFEPFLPSKFGKKLELSSRNRYRYLVELRFIYFFIARSMGYNIVTIAKSIGMDHTSVIHGLNTFANLCETNDPIIQKYNKIINYIKLNYEPSTVEPFNTL
jgi:hypothetical protein